MSVASAPAASLAHSKDGSAPKMGEARASSFEDVKRLYSDEDDREILNSTAANFFWDLQREQHFGIMLHLCRLTDPEEMRGRGGTRVFNLTIKRIPPLVDDAGLALRVAGLITAAETSIAFARDWRNRRLSHEELPSSVTGQPAIPFPRAAWKDFEEAIGAIIAVMNAVSLHYCGSTTLYSRGTSLAGGVGSLLHFLRLGLEADRARRAKLHAASP